MLPRGMKNYKIIRLHLVFFQIATSIAICAPAFPVNAADWQISRRDKEVTVGAPNVRFDVGGTFSASTGCNSILGKAQYDGQDLVIDGPVATTRMACAGDTLTEQDSAVIALFAGRISVNFDPLRNILRLSNDKTALELAQLVNFEPSVPDTHGGLERPKGEPPYVSSFSMTGQLNIRSQPSIYADILGVIDSGTLLRNTGCVEKVDLRWCEVATVNEVLTGWAEDGSLEPADSVLRAGQSVYDAVGLVPCAIGLGAPTAQCAFGVARDDGRSATVVVTKPDGIERILFFADDERYEIPDAVIFGG